MLIKIKYILLLVFRNVHRTGEGWDGGFAFIANANCMRQNLSGSVAPLYTLKPTLREIKV
jgi:hypothetical protein